jgi:hypothetical protein
VTPEKHLEKAKRIENSQSKLDPEEDWELIIEGVYGAAVNYIAYICEQKFEWHIDDSEKLVNFLETNEMPDIAELVKSLEKHRTGKWIGGQRNGHAVLRVRKLLEEIKKEI